MVQLDNLFPHIGLFPPDSPDLQLLRGAADAVGYAWAAALIDGEGCITAAKYGRDYYKAIVVVTNTCRELMAPLTHLFGGRICNDRVMTDEHKQVYRWATTSAIQTEYALKAIRPFLIAKTEQADTALEICELLLAGSRIRDVHGSRNPDYLAALESLKQRIHRLNARGPAR